MANSPEYRTIKKQRRLLVQFLAQRLNIADELCSEDFIPSGVCSEMGTVGVSAQEKASKLVDNVLHQIEVKPARFEEFLTILDNDSSLSGVIETLRETLIGVYKIIII